MNVSSFMCVGFSKSIYIKEADTKARLEGQHREEVYHTTTSV